MSFKFNQQGIKNKYKCYLNTFPRNWNRKIFTHNNSQALTISKRYQNKKYMFSESNCMIFHFLFTSERLVIGIQIKIGEILNNGDKNM